ncbi:MAG: TIGR00159 family protein [Ruminococcaceae bacterium]|nr:TIGR00159 family protein [Oscillospiraceae bacterium]
MFKKDWLSDFFTGVIHIIQSIELVDIIDILAVSVLFYFVYKFIRNKRAGKLITGILLLLVALLISEVTGMLSLQFIFENFFQVGVLALVILFQPELRSALEKMGGTSLKSLKPIVDRKSDFTLVVREVASAAAEMSSDKTGALIVCERTTKLGEIIATGSTIDANVNSFLLRNIFFNKAPLHDGATIISGGRICAAGCLLPLSAQNDINRNLGTRHRAALGLSENSDAVVVVVSEETGVISVAVDGKLTRGFTQDTLRAHLTDLLVQETDKDQIKVIKPRKKKGQTKKSKEAASDEE